MFELRHADIADILFLGKLAVDPKYRLLSADIFNSKIYTYSMPHRATVPEKKIYKFPIKIHQNIYKKRKY